MLQGKYLCKSVKSVGFVLCPTDFTDLHRYNDKGLYATMNRWRIDPWLYGDIRNLHLSYYIYYELLRFLMSRYAILLVSYSLISCGVNLAISPSSKRRSKPKLVSKLMYLSSTCFIRFMFLFVMQRLCQRAQWKLAFWLPSAAQSSAKIRWIFVTSKFSGLL